MPSSDELPSWTDGTAKTALVDFLDQVEQVLVHHRMAAIDNDGTLWCERPLYVQHEFVIWAVRRRRATDPEFRPSDTLNELVDNPSGGPSTTSIDAVTAALNETFVGMAPDAFADLAREFGDQWKSDRFDRSLPGLRYRPMLELLAALRRRSFDIYIVTGGGAEFVRAFSMPLYGVPEDRIIGSLVEYRYDAESGQLERGGAMVGKPNEGADKVQRIQWVTGRRPIFAAGNSAGDAEMLEYVAHGDGPRLAMLIDHDDAQREAAYKSVAASFDHGEDIVEVGRAKGWTIVSMREDWSEVFADPEARAGADM